MNLLLLMYHIELLLGSSFLKKSRQLNTCIQCALNAKANHCLLFLMKKVVVGDITDIAFNDIRFAYSPKHASVSKWYPSP